MGVRKPLEASQAAETGGREVPALLGHLEEGEVTHVGGGVTTRRTTSESPARTSRASLAYPPARRLCEYLGGQGEPRVPGSWGRRLEVRKKSLRTG